MQKLTVAKSKRMKLEGKGETTKTTDMDKISALPDELICHILSFLPTRTSMATSILSRRWRHLWNHLQVFDIYDKPFDLPAGENRFIAFADAALSRRKYPNIHKLHLSCDEMSEGKPLTSWIHTAIGPCIKELHLSVGNHHIEGLDLPPEIFTSKSLVSLVLNDCIDLALDHIPNIHLPSLKNLEVDVCNLNPDKLLSGCPVLENLKLVLHNIDPDATPSIHVPRSVKKLTLEDGFPHDYVIEHLDIDTPSLEYLHLTIHARYLKVSTSHFPHMEQAYLHISPDNQNSGWVSELLKKICTTKLLVLRYITAQCIADVPTLEFPEFSRLAHLHLCAPCFNPSLITKLLHKCNILQALVIHHKNGVCAQNRWKPPMRIPKCVVSHLQSIEFGSYQGHRKEHAFAAFLLRRGLVLKNVTVHTEELSLQKKYQMLNDLSFLPRRSKSCHLRFY